MHSNDERPIAPRILRELSEAPSAPLSLSVMAHNAMIMTAQ